MDSVRVVDDAQILRIAEPPAVPLFRLLDRTRALEPLFVVLVTVALAFALRYRTLDDEAARWALQVARVAASDSVLPEIDEAAPEPGHFAAPLALWLSATSIALLPAQWTWAVLVPSMLSFVATIALLRIVVGNAFGGRTGVWCTALACLHPLLLEAAVTPAPQSTAVLFAILTVGSHLDHRRADAGPFDRRTWLTGAALGLTLLTSGPVGVVVAFAVVLDGLSEAFAPPPEPETPAARVRGPRNRTQVLLATVTVLVAAAAVAGWWIAANVARTGPAALAGWLAFPGRAGRSAWPMAFPLVIVLSWRWLGGLVLIGLWSAVRTLRRRDAARPEGSASRLVVTWLVAASIAAAVVDPSATVARSSWTLAAVPAVLVLAALGIETIAQRRIRARTALVALLAWPAVLVPAATAVSPGSLVATQPAVVWTVLTVCAAACLLAVRWSSGRRDQAYRGLLTAGILGTLATFGGTGLAATNRATIDDRTLRELQIRLAPHRHAEATLVVSDAPPPLPLTSVLRILSPRAPVVPVPNRDVALGRVLDVLRPGEHAIAVELETRQSRPLDVEPRRLRVVRTLPAHPYERRRLRAYVLTLLDEGARTAAVAPNTAAGDE